MALKLLIADPDYTWLEQAEKYFSEKGHKIVTAKNGKDAQKSLYNQKYSFVVLNFELQDHSGFQVLKHIHLSYSKQKVVMIINGTETLTPHELTLEKLKHAGATDIIQRPFELKALEGLMSEQQNIGSIFAAMEKRDGISAEETVQGKDTDYTSIDIDDFYSPNQVLFDIYIRLKNDHYVKILHAGDRFSEEWLNKQKSEKGTKSLYFHKSDRNKYIQFSNLISKTLIKSDKVSTGQKINFLKTVSQKFLEEDFTEGIKTHAIEAGKQVCNSIYALVENQPDLYKHLRDMNDLDPTAFTHAYLVTLYASAIIKQFDWQSQATIENTAFACMFHDIGKLKFPEGMITMDPQTMDEGQLAEYKRHPDYALDIISNNKMISNSTKQIIQQHHECFDGTGFPHKLKGKNILLLANIVCLADDFVHSMIRDKKKPMDALKIIISDQKKVSRYNTVILENFIKVFADPGRLKIAG